jgi:branched-chain amino acid transport system permease protein
LHETDLLHTLLQTLTDGIAVGSLYALIALGYTLVFGILQFINFAHGDVFALGALLSAAMAGWLASHLHLGFVTPLVVALIVPVAAIGACALVGFCIERFAYRPLRNAPRLNVLITAIGVSLLMENVGQLHWAFSTLPQPVPVLIPDVVFPKMSATESPQTMHFHSVDLVILAVALSLMLLLQMIVFRTRFGTAMRAVSFNPKAAALMGINVDQVIALTFVIGSALAGAAGYLFAVKYQTGTLNQPADALWILLGMKAFVAAVVGGIGNLRGAMLGGLLIGLVEHFGAAAGGLGQELGLWQRSIDTAQFKDVLVFALLILVLLIRPAGLLGKATVEKV